MASLLRGWGLRIESGLPVPGAQVEAGSPAGPAAPDIRVETGEATLEDGGAVLGPYRLHRGALLFTMPGVARFLCHPGGTRLSVEPEPHADPKLLSAVLIATALPAVLWMRGEWLLHAGAAVPVGAHAAIAFAGSSGSGKSTLLRGLVEAGAEVVADDSLRVQLPAELPVTAKPATARPVTASGLPGSIHLRSGAPLQAGAEQQTGRTRIPIPPAQQRAQAPLGAVVVLETSGSPAAGAAPVRLLGADALAALLRHLHRPRIPRLLGQTAALLPRLARLASAVPVYSWSPQGRMPGFELADLKLPAGWADEGSSVHHGGPL